MFIYEIQLFNSYMFEVQKFFCFIKILIFIYCKRKQLSLYLECLLLNKLNKITDS